MRHTFQLCFCTGVQATVHTASRGTDAEQSLPHFLSTPGKSAQSKRPRMEVGKEEDDDFRISSPVSQDLNYDPGDTVTNFSDLM